jgi:hypothetical protein
MAWLKEMWSGWFDDPSAAERPDIERIREMLDYLSDEPYVPAAGRATH